MWWVAPVALALAVTGAAPSRSVPAPAAVAAVTPDTIRPPLVVSAADPKVAVVGSAASLVGSQFVVVDASAAQVHSGVLTAAPGSSAPWAHAALANFSAVTQPGTYRLRVGALESVPFVVSAAPYAAVLASLLGVFDANRDGTERSTYHAASHLHDQRSVISTPGSLKGDVVDMRGGWMDAGDQLKFTGTIAYAAAMLQLGARVNGSLRASLRAHADVGVRYLLKAHPRSKVFVSQVGNTTADHNAGFRDPTRDDRSSNPLLSKRPSMVLTATTGGADVAGAAAAALALAAQRASGKKKTRLVRAAQAWLAQALKLRKVWSNCCYQQDTWLDDVSSAQVELGLATGKASYFTDGLKSLKSATGNGSQGWRVSMDGYEMAALPAAELCALLGARPKVSAGVRADACRILRAGGADAAYNASLDAFGRAAPIQWGSARGAITGGLVAFLAGRAGQSSGTSVGLRSWGWFLGANPWGVRFQGAYGVQHPYHWSQLGGANRPRGAVVGGPAPVADISANGDPFVPGPFDTATVGYRDVPDDYVTNEVGITYNSSAVLFAALLAAR
jgi:endoglucanase